MYNFNFICRKSKQDKKGLAPIELSIIINHQRCYVSLPLKVSPSDFKIKAIAKRSNEITDYISNVRYKINQYINTLIVTGQSISCERIKDYIKYGERTIVYTIDDLKNDYLSYMNKRYMVGEIGKNSVYKYQITLDRFVNFVGMSKDITSITTQDIENFKLEMLKNMEMGSVSRYMVALKSSFIFAMNNNKLKNNPFAMITINRVTKEVQKLSKDEVKRIEDKHFAIERLNRVKDLFLFQCYTGLSYCDMAMIVKDDIKMNGETFYVKKKRKKTNVEYISVLNDKAMSILHKYNYVLPVLSNQKYNAYLQEIRELCYITIPLTTHIARHTCATMLLNNGTPLEIVAKVLGHSNLNQTKHYAKMLDSTIISYFKEKSF